MEREAVCPTCNSTLQQPLRLPCSHVFCSACIGEFVRNSEAKRESPTCPLCRKLIFTSLDDNRALPDSEYHRHILRLLDPAGTKVCVDCHKGEPMYVCHDGCGVFCADCNEHHHRSAKTRSHQTKPMAQATAAEVEWDANKCILHNNPITCICDQCLDSAELCELCLANDKRENPTHTHRKISALAPDMVSLDRLYLSLEEKTCLIEASLKRIVEQKKFVQNRETESIETMKNIFSAMKKQIEAFEKETIKNIEDACSSSHRSLEAAEIEKKHTHNILFHGMELIREARNIYEKQRAISKVVKSKRFADAAKLIPTKELPDVQTRGIDFEKHKLLMVSQEHAEFILKSPHDVESILGAQLKDLVTTVHSVAQQGREMNSVVGELRGSLDAEKEKTTRLEEQVRHLEAVVKKVAVPGVLVTHENAAPNLRVRRSKTWNRNEEDGNQPGTLLKPTDDTKLSWRVRWDANRSELVYCTGFKGHFHLEFA